jgi:hypothetical protein
MTPDYPSAYHYRWQVDYPKGIDSDLQHLDMTAELSSEANAPD